MGHSTLFSVDRIDPMGRSNRKGEILLSIDVFGKIQDINRAGVEKLGLIEKDVVIDALRGTSEEKTLAQTQIDEIYKSIRGRLLSEFINLELFEGIEEEQACGGQLEKWDKVVREGALDPLYVQPDVTPIFNENNELIGRYIGLGDVTTLQLKTEQSMDMMDKANQLQKDEESLRKKLEFAWMHAADGKISLRGYSIKKSNLAIAELLGYIPEEIQGQDILSLPFMTEEGVLALKKLGEKRVNIGEFAKDTCEIKCINKKGAEVWLEGVFTRTKQTGKPVRTDISFHDVTEKVLEKRRNEEVFMKSPVGQIRMKNFTIVKSNIKITKILGFSHEELDGLDLTRAPFLSKKAKLELFKVAQNKIEEGEEHETVCELQCGKKDGSQVWLKAILAREQQNGELLTTVVFEDITAQKEAEEQRVKTEQEKDLLLEELQKLATTDSLTGLLNRRAFYDEASKRFGEADRRGETSAIITLDIDHFKKINDTYGHNAGDEYLKAFSHVLNNEVRKDSGDIVARFGGEEFIILLPEADEQRAQRVCERIRQAVEKIEVNTPNNVVQATTSIGFVIRKVNDNRDIDDIINSADKALYQAKESGRNQVVEFREAQAAE